MQTGHSRTELKYICPEETVRRLRERFDAVLTPDSHAGEEGTYLIRSIYFDDMANTAYHENGDGTNPKQKWRIRAYNNDPETLRLECKHSARGRTWKDTCLLRADAVRTLLDSGTVALREPVTEQGRSVYRQFCLLQNTRRLQPVAVIQYRRRPYVVGGGMARVTIDEDICVSKALSAFFDADLRIRPVMPSGQQLLEVKFDRAFPPVVAGLIRPEPLLRTSFSKYRLCRERSFYDVSRAG